ncbi:MAG: threonylcarbamoyl-AMP synthase [Nanoarchaeota archaeon]|nr:threonylcarbamoyl-AMP synthase [Nanoarchaeota archaeon]
MTEVVKPNRDGIEEAVKILKKGGIIIYPTETAYAIGCDITNKKAIKKLYKIKKRPKSKGTTAIVSDIEMAKKFGKISKLEEKIVKKFMPGPLTLIVPKKKKIPDIANKEFAFRISKNKIARKLSKLLGKPIAATSANLSGKKPIYEINKIKKIFANKIGLIIDAGDLEKKKVSTIVKVEDGKIKVLRKGVITGRTIKSIKT